LKKVCKDLDFQIHQFEVAEQERRVAGLRSTADAELESHKEMSKGQLVEQERRIRDLERKLNDATRKLGDRQMLKMGADEFSVKHICSTQTMQEAMILLRRGIVVRAQSTSWREFFCFNPWVTTRVTLKASTTEKGKLDFDLCFLSKLAPKKCYCPLLDCSSGAALKWKKLGQAEGPFFIKRMLKLSELDRVSTTNLSSPHRAPRLIHLLRPSSDPLCFSRKRQASL
jgi:hypothetical protein